MPVDSPEALPQFKVDADSKLGQHPSEFFNFGAAEGVSGSNKFHLVEVRAWDLLSPP